MFGAIPMALEGVTTKLHTMPGTNQLLITKLFTISHKMEVAIEETDDEAAHSHQHQHRHTVTAPLNKPMAKMAPGVSNTLTRSASSPQPSHPPSATTTPTKPTTNDSASNPTTPNPPSASPSTLAPPNNNNQPKTRRFSSPPPADKQPQPAGKVITTRYEHSSYERGRTAHAVVVVAG